MSNFLRALQPEAVVPPLAPAIDVVPAAIAALATVPAAAPPVATAARSKKRPNLTLLSAIAAGLALVLGILVGRIDSGVETPATRPGPVNSATALQAQAPPSQPDDAVAKASADDAPATAPEPAPVADIQPVVDGAAGLVFFDGPTMQVSQRAVVAAIPLRHLNRERRAVSVSWRVLDGTARAGQDYGGPSSGTAPFIEGNSFRILYVPILQRAGETGNRTFSVELTAASEGVSLGPPSRVEVTILGES
jgi:Calx-beta domain